MPPSPPSPTPGRLPGHNARRNTPGTPRRTLAAPWPHQTPALRAAGQPVADAPGSLVTATLLLLGAVLLGLALVDRAVRRLPLTPALMWLGRRCLAGRAPAGAIGRHLPTLTPVTGLAALATRTRRPPGAQSSFRPSLRITPPQRSYCSFTEAACSAAVLLTISLAPSA